MQSVFWVFWSMIGGIGRCRGPTVYSTGETCLRRRLLPLLALMKPLAMCMLSHRGSQAVRNWGLDWLTVRSWMLPTSMLNLEREPFPVELWWKTRPWWTPCLHKDTLKLLWKLELNDQFFAKYILSLCFVSSWYAFSIHFLKSPCMHGFQTLVAD